MDDQHTVEPAGRGDWYEFDEQGIAVPITQTNKQRFTGAKNHN